MVQTHCQVKTDNENLFEHYGIKTGNIVPDLKKINLDKLEDKKSEDDESVKITNKKKKILEPA